MTILKAPFKIISRAKSFAQLNFLLQTAEITIMYNNNLLLQFRIFNRNEGFSLVETIVAVILVSFFVNGLLLSWYFIDSRQRSVEAYWSAKQELELAMEITQQYLRESAHRNLIILTNEIRFTDHNGANWVFNRTADGSYRLIRNGKVENVILNQCSLARFTKDEQILLIELGIEPPPQWSGDSSHLQITGSVYLRNYDESD